MSESAIRLIAAVAALIIMSIGLAHAQTVQKIEIHEFGIYSGPEGVEVGLTRQGVPHSVVDYINVIQRTDTVIAQIGTRFGFRYRILGAPAGSPVALKMVMRFPKPGVLAPGGVLPFVDDDFTVVQFIGRDSFRTWTFTERSDLVPGIWTFEIWQGDKKLAEQKFNVILPPIANRQSPALPGGGKVG